MSISILIIAHNEEKYIEKCIQSLLAQTKKADEIVLINHNSTDRTGEIARKYPAVKVVEHTGPVGPAYARIRGFAEVTSEIVLCIDGDAYAARNWVETMVTLLSEPNMVMVGSWVRMAGTAYTLLAEYYWYFFCSSRGFKATDFLWGASLGLRKRDTNRIIRALEEGVKLSEQLNLAYNPDDFWLSLFMSERGDLEVSNRTWVRAHAKETNSLQMVRRGIVARGIRSTIHGFLAHHALPKLDVNEPALVQ